MIFVLSVYKRKKTGQLKSSNYTKYVLQIEDLQKKKGDVDMRSQQNLELVPLPVPPPG